MSNYLEDHTSTKSGKNCLHYVVKCILNNQQCNQNCVEPSFFRQIAASITKSGEGTVQQYPTSCSSNSRKEFSETGLINRKHGLDVVCGESTLLSGANST